MIALTDRTVFTKLWLAALQIVRLLSMRGENNLQNLHCEHAKLCKRYEPCDRFS